MWKCHKLVFAAERIFCNNTKSNWKNPTRLSVERIRAMLTTRLACNNTSSLLPSIGTHTSKRINKCADKTHTAHITRKTSRVKIKNMNRPFKTGFLLPHHTVSNCGDIMNKMPLLWWSTPTAEAEKTSHDAIQQSKNIKLGEETRLFAPSTFLPACFPCRSPRVVRTEDNTSTQASPSLNPATVQSCLVPRSPPPWISKRMHAYPVGIFPLFLRFFLSSPFASPLPAASPTPPPPLTLEFFDWKGLEQIKSWTTE